MRNISGVETQTAEKHKNVVERPIVPKYLTMPHYSKARARAWLAWRKQGTDNPDYDDLLRDGGYDLYRLASKIQKKRQSKFKPVLDELLQEQPNG